MTLPTSTVLAYIPSPPQGVWYVGPLPLRAYALCIIVGIIVAVWWGNRRWIARGGQDGEVLDVAIWAVPFGLIGGRIYHVATDWRTYFGDGPKSPIDAIRIWDGGLGIWGAVFFGALGAWIGCRRHGIKLSAFGDAIAPPILLAQAIGRFGNYFNQELYGRETTVPWGLKIYERVDSAGNADPGVITGVSNGNVVAIVHPTFLYEILWNVLVVILLVVIDRYFRIGHGRLFALYVAGYCVGRFFVELMRSDPATHVLGVRINVFTAILVFACAAAYVVLAPKGREQGLEMYHDGKAEELAEAGVVGYIDPEQDYDDSDVEGFYLNDDDLSDDEQADDDVPLADDESLPTTEALPDEAVPEEDEEPVDDEIYDDGDYGDEIHDLEADDESERVDLEGHHIVAPTDEPTDAAEPSPNITKAADVEDVTADEGAVDEGEGAVDDNEGAVDEGEGAVDEDEGAVDEDDAEPSTPKES